MVARSYRCFRNSNRHECPSRDATLVRMEAVSESSEARISRHSFGSGLLKTFLICSLTSLLIACLWTINKQRLADFYDYTVYTYSGAFFKLGLKPYVDF